MIKFSSPSLSKKEISNVINTLNSSWITSGQEELSLQKKLKKIYKKKYCILFSSWTTAAYSLFLLLNKNKKNYEVILPSLSFIATANAPLLAKCKIKFTDVDKETFNLSPNQIIKSINKKTKCILVVDQIGNPFDIQKIYKLCKKKKIKIVHDAACSLGSKYKKNYSGVFSDFVVLSFQARKVVTSGEGGAILFNDKKYYQLLSQQRNHGMDKNTYERSKLSPINSETYHVHGLNFRYNDILASITNAQISRLSYLIQNRKRIAKKYNNFFKKNFPKVQLQEIQKTSSSNYQSYMVLLKNKKDRDQMLRYLYKNGIESRKSITAIHKQKAFKKIYGKINLPNTEYIYDRGIQLPMHPLLKNKDIEFIQKKIFLFLKNKNY